MNASGPAAASVGRRWASLCQGVLKLGVGLLLYGLSVLELLNEFHLKHFHLHNLLFLCSNDCFLLGHSLIHLCLSFHLLATDEFLLLEESYSFLLLDHLVLGSCILGNLIEEDLLPLLVLHLHELLLLNFLLLREVDCLLDLLALHLSLFALLIDPVLVFFLHHLVHS